MKKIIFYVIFILFFILITSCTLINVNYGKNSSNFNIIYNGEINYILEPVVTLIGSKKVEVSPKSENDIVIKGKIKEGVLSVQVLDTKIMPVWWDGKIILLSKESNVVIKTLFSYVKPKSSASLPIKRITGTSFENDKLFNNINIFDIDNETHVGLPFKLFEIKENNKVYKVNLVNGFVDTISKYEKWFIPDLLKYEKQVAQILDENDNLICETNFNKYFVFENASNIDKLTIQKIVSLTVILKNFYIYLFNRDLK